MRPRSRCRKTERSAKADCGELLGDAAPQAVRVKSCAARDGLAVQNLRRRAREGVRHGAYVWKIGYGARVPSIRRLRTESAPLVA